MKIPTNVYSASLHPNKSVFVCGGEDLIMYKYDYISGLELGKYVLDLKNNTESRNIFPNVLNVTIIQFFSIKFNILSLNTTISSC